MMIFFFKIVGEPQKKLSDLDYTPYTVVSVLLIL